MANPERSRSTAEDAADEAEAVNAAATERPEPAEPKGRDAKTAKARDAEHGRQDDVRKAVAKAHKAELPELGGPMLEPGLGR